MELLNRLNALSSLSQFKKMNELNVGEKYPVTEIKQITTKYGKKIVVQLSECAVSLPSRFNENASDYLKLNDIKPLYFIYLGSRDVGKSLPAHMFQFEQ